MCTVLELPITTRPVRRPALAFAWRDATVSAPPPPAPVPLVNARCLDIRKSTVQAAHARALGYPLAVDPLTHAGPIVLKSETNATHDGRIVPGPLAAPPPPGLVAERLVRNEAPGGLVEELRVPLVGPEVPFVYVKRRPEAERFAEGRRVTVEMVAPSEVLSAGELDGLRRLAALLGLDCGELDVLRDREDGRVYAVDVAKTPWGPPRGLAMVDQQRAVAQLAVATVRRLLRRDG